MTQDERDKRDLEDARHLVAQPEFRRFLWRAIQLARIFDRTADGSQGDTAYGRRNLGLEILQMVEEGQPVPHPDGQPILTILQTLREEANQPGSKSSGRRTDERYDRNRDLNGNSDGDDAGE